MNILLSVKPKYAGISKKDSFDYFKNSEMAFAIEIGYVDSFKEHIDPVKIIENFKPPQSFYYIPFTFQQNQ